MSEETKKEGFFRKVIKSVKDFDKYEDFAIEKPGEALKYLMKLIALFCAIICIAYTYKILGNMNKLYAGLKDKVPEFSYENGQLKSQSEEPTIIEDYKDMVGTIIVDTEIENDKVYDTYYSEKIQKYGLGMVFTKNNLIIYNPQINGQLVYKYSDVLSPYNMQNFNKQDVINNVENMNVVSISLSIYFMIFIYTFILYFISILADVLILALLAYVVARFSRIRLKSSPAFSIAVHSITLSIILNLIYIVINLLTGFEIKYFGLMYNTISYIYIIVAILMIKTDFINRQAELIKIAEAQMKIKEELEKQEQEKKEEKKEEDDDKEVKDVSKPEKENKPKNKKEKKDKSTDEPVGDATCSNNE